MTDDIKCPGNFSVCGRDLIHKLCQLVAEPNELGLGAAIDVSQRRNHLSDRGAKMSYVDRGPI
jgi:hypothetical protein